MEDKKTLSDVPVTPVKVTKREPVYYIPGTKKPGEQVVIGVTLYQVGEDGNLLRLSPKTSKKSRHKARVAERNARKNPNLTAKLEARDLKHSNALMRRARYLNKKVHARNLAKVSTAETSNEGNEQ